MFLKNVGQLYEDVAMGEIPVELKARVASWKFHDSGEASGAYYRRWVQYALPSGKIMEFIWHRHDGYGKRVGRVDLIVGLLIDGRYQ